MEAFVLFGFPHAVKESSFEWTFSHQNLYFSLKAEAEVLLKGVFLCFLISVPNPVRAERWEHIRANRSEEKAITLPETRIYLPGLQKIIIIRIYVYWFFTGQWWKWCCGKGEHRCRSPPALPFLARPLVSIFQGKFGEFLLPWKCVNFQKCSR